MAPPPRGSAGLVVVAQARSSGASTATMALVPGSLLNETRFADTVALEPGLVVAAVALKAGQYPPELATGDRVLVVGTGPAAEPGGLPGSAAGRVLAEGARVSGIRTGSGPGGQAAVVSLVVERELAAELVAAAGAGQVGPVLEGAG